MSCLTSLSSAFSDDPIPPFSFGFASYPSPLVFFPGSPMTHNFQQYCLTKCLPIDFDSYQPSNSISECILHYNVRGLVGRLDDLKELLHNLSDSAFSPLCILLCETFLNEHNAKLCNIDGYSLVRNDRNAHGGGVAIYVSDSLSYTPCDHLTYNIENEFESIFIECSLRGLPNPLLIGEIYRTPNSNLHLTHERYNALLHKIPRNQQVVIGTDQNIDYFKLHLNSHTDFLQMFVSQGFIPCISEATRVTASTATLIDNIYIKGITPADSHIITAHYSDHYPIMISLPSCSENKSKSITFKSRKFNPDTYSKIEADLLAHDWSNLHTMDSNPAYTYFTDTLMQIIDKHAPIRSKTIRKRNLRREPWFTKALQISSKKLHKLYKHSIKSKSLQSQAHYTQYRNMYNKIRKAAKNIHYTQLFNEYRNNIKKTWHLIHNLTGNQRTGKNPIQSLDINGTLISNPQQIVEAFAIHFATVSTRSSALPFQHQDHSHIIPANTSFFLTPTTHDEILKIIQSMKSKKSSGHDTINTQHLKKLNYFRYFKGCGECAF
jgi:hypothetical protein